MDGSILFNNIIIINLQAILQLGNAAETDQTIRGKALLGNL